MYGAAQSNAQASCAIDDTPCTPYASSSGAQVAGGATSVICACTRLSRGPHTLRLAVSPADGAVLAVDYIEYTTVRRNAPAVLQQDSRVLARGDIHDPISILETTSAATIIPNSGTGSFLSPAHETTTLSRRGSRLSPVAGGVVIAVATFSCLGLVLLSAFAIWRRRRRKQNKQRQQQQQRACAMTPVELVQRQPYSAGSTAIGSPLTDKVSKFSTSDISHDDAEDYAPRQEQALASPEGIDKGAVISTAPKGKLPGRENKGHVRWVEAETGTGEVAASVRKKQESGRAPPVATSDVGRGIQSSASTQKGKNTSRDVDRTLKVPGEAEARMRDTVAAVRARRSASAPTFEHIAGISEATPTLSMRSTARTAVAPSNGQGRAGVRAISSGPRAMRTKDNTVERVPTAPEKGLPVSAAVVDDSRETSNEPISAESTGDRERRVKRSQSSTSPHWFLSYAEATPEPEAKTALLVPPPELSQDTSTYEDVDEAEANLEEAAARAPRPESVDSTLSYVPSNYNQDMRRTSVAASTDGHARLGESPTPSVAMSAANVTPMKRAVPAERHAPSAFPAAALGMDSNTRRSMRPSRRTMSAQSVSSISSYSSIISAPPAPPPNRGLPPTPRPRPGTAPQATGRSQSQESRASPHRRQRRSSDTLRSPPQARGAPPTGWI